MVETILPAVVDETTQTAVEKLEAWTKTVVVKTAEEREAVYAAVKEVKTYRSNIVQFFKDSKEKAHATWKAIVGNEKTFTDRLDAFEVAAKKAILTYDQEVERVRVAEERRLQAIADEKARKEREKQEAEARRQRQIEEDARAKAEAARRAAEQASAEDRQRLQKEAEAAERKAAAAAVKAESKEETAQAVVAPVIQVAKVTEKQAGEATRGIWKARVVDLSLVPREYLIANETALNQVAKATKGAIKIAGVEFYEEKSLSIRR